MKEYYQTTLEDALEPDKLHVPRREEMWRYSQPASYYYFCPVCNGVVGSVVDGEWIGLPREECVNGHKMLWSESLLRTAPELKGRKK